MESFIFTQDVAKQIAKKTNTTESIVNTLNLIYKDISKKMKSQYLAHLIRTIEEIVRQREGFEKFIIRCKPFETQNEKIARHAIARYYETKKMYYIYYPQMADERFTRVVIAHELGHLMTEMLKDKIGQAKNQEPYATVLGILAIMDKNNFYSNRQNFLLHTSCTQIIDDFTLL